MSGQAKYPSDIIVRNDALSKSDSNFSQKSLSAQAESTTIWLAQRSYISDASKNMVMTELMKISHRQD